jgi:hypothetical protein
MSCFTTVTAIVTAGNTIWLFWANWPRLHVSATRVFPAPSSGSSAYGVVIPPSTTFPRILVQIVNASQRDARLAAITMSGRRTGSKVWEPVDQPSPDSYEGCMSLPHIMPPRSRIKARYTSDYDAAMLALYEVLRVTVETEDGRKTHREVSPVSPAHGK